MAICVSQAVITSFANDVTGETERTVESMTTGRREETEPELMPECGRLVFRGVELAYLNINGKQMLPLAEMLALVFHSTPRTTLFTRMEKINAERHFCQPSEIKLLKTVNGIHGSSANCTLIPREDVERYCSIYVDRVAVEEPAACRSPRKEKKVPRKDDWSEIKAVKTKNNAKLEKITEVDTHDSESNDTKLKVVKATSNIEAREINTTVTAACIQSEICGNNGEAVESSSADNNEHTVSSRHSSSPLSQTDREHASNGTQTISMLSWSTKKHANNVVEVNKNAKLRWTKKRKRAAGADDQEDHKFNSPLKEHTKLQEQGGTNSTGKSPKPRKRRNVALTLNVDSGISDDSGFTSLTFEDCTSPTKVEKTGTRPKLKCDLLSPDRPKKQIKNKTKPSPLELSDKLNLSPPPLVIKKHQNTWQVETKLEGVKKVLYKPKNQKMKMPKGTVVNGLLAATADEQPLKKKKSQRKLFITGQGASVPRRPSSMNKEQIAEADAEGVGKKKRRRRKVAETSTSEAINGTTPDLCFATPEKKKKKVKKGPKKSKIGAKVNNFADAPANTQGHGLVTVLASSITPQSKPLKHAAPSGIKLTPVKPPVLKATPNFSLMDLFPSTSGLIIHGGDLCPEFTMAYDPNAGKPASPHPIWKWRVGGPVIAKTHKVSFRIRKIKQPNSTAKSCTSAARNQVAVTNTSSSPSTSVAADSASANSDTGKCKSVSGTLVRETNFPNTLNTSNSHF